MRGYFSAKVGWDKSQLSPNVPPGLCQLQPVCKPTKWLAFWPWLAFCSDGSLGNPRNCFLRTPVVLNREKSGCHIAMILGKKESNAMQCNHAEQHYSALQFEFVILVDNRLTLCF